MFAVASPWLCWTLLSVSLVGFTCADQKTITVESGQNVTLTCRAPNNNITVIEWKTADLGEEYVLLYRQNFFDTTKQHPSFKNRVDLQDRQMKDGDVSLILKDVTINDTGTYECLVFMRETRSWKITSIICLTVVDPPGQTGGDIEDGSVGLKVGLPVAAIVTVAAVGGVFLIYRKCKSQKQGLYQPPIELQPV
ncbi:programmed cell death 1 ligand 1-like [Oreochromis aureus]|uniref:programmed cell death 1 ligand 1-like n=1 Tax=Oreochromis aureus TaxID=47969 RepID=UPI00195453D9|nr:programmed cell death 1 ligand 1-like [Oreochromis aureus]